MLTGRVRMWVVLAMGLPLIVAASSALAQSRKGVDATQVGGFRTVGRSGISERFVPYSYGIGGLRSSGAGANRSLLQSSIGRPSGFGIRRGGGVAPGAASAAPTSNMPLSSGARLYNPTENVLSSSVGRGQFGGPLSSMGSGALGAASAYLAELNAVSEDRLKKTDQPITSLVPSEPGLYHQYMKDGEAAFKEGDFHHAYDLFEMANYIGNKDPESLLSLTHAAFARSLYSYSSAALYLRLALKYLPELPLASLQPKAFYGETPEAASRYDERIFRLKKHLMESPRDPDGLLLLAYFRWFEGNVKAAQQALSSALDAAQTAKNPETVEIIGIFWDGMVATGKVSGVLSLTPGPITTTQPEAARLSPAKLAEDSEHASQEP